MATTKKTTTKKTVKAAETKGLKDFYPMTRKGILDFSRDMVKAGLFTEMAVLGAGKAPIAKDSEHLTGWIWAYTKEDVYKEKIKNKIPAFHLFFSFAGQGAWTTRNISDIGSYCSRAEALSMLTDDTGNMVSSSKWATDTGERPNKPAKQSDIDKLAAKLAAKGYKVVKA